MFGIDRILSPEETSPAEEAVAAWVRAVEIAKLNDVVDAASLRQQREQQEAEAALAEATKQMTNSR
jgi:hypothetical protein